MSKTTPNLIEELSPDYCNELLTGALFLLDGKPYEFLAAKTRRNATPVVIAHRFSGSTEAVETTEETIPSEKFVGWSSLAFPTLGYRQAAAGQVLAYITRTPSVRRGLNRRDLHVDMHDVSMTCNTKFGLDLAYFQRGPALHMMTLNPVYTTLEKGVKDVIAGKIPAFAISPDFAVAPAIDVPFLEILFRQRRVGTIDDKGNIELTVAEARPSWKKATT